MSDNPENNTTQSSTKEAKKDASVASSPIKTRLTLQTEPEHEFSKLSLELKKTRTKKISILTKLF